MRASHGDGLPAVRKRRSQGRPSRGRRVPTTPIIATTTYLDTFGNRCRRLVAPPGDLTIWGDAQSKPTAKLILPTLPQRNFRPELPDSCLLYLMGSLYCETDKLSQAAWDLSAKSRRAGGACKPCAMFHQHIKFDYMQRDRPERRLRPSRSGLEFAAISPISGDALSMTLHSGPLRQRSSCDIGVPVSIRWISAPGRCFSTGAGGLSILAQRPADRQDRGRTRP